MKNLLRIAVTSVVAAVLLLLADTILQPVPIPAGMAVLGGLLAVWFRSEARTLWVTVGLVIGGLIGTGAHLFMHLTGGSTVPEEGVVAHVAADGIRGFAVGGIVILLVALVARLLPSEADA
jgi:hypothetical protein